MRDTSQVVTDQQVPANAWVSEAKFVSWWLEFDDLAWPDPRLTQKWQRRAKLFADRGANAVVMFGLHFRWDYYALVERVLGILREISLICHEHGLRVVEHHSATLVHRVRHEQDRREIRTRNKHHVPFYPDDWETVFYRGHRLADWRQISARDGRPVFFEQYTCECFCPNHPSYQSAYLDYIARHLIAVPVDAMMSDDLHYLPDVYSCACGHCRSRFKEEEGIELPPADDRSFWENYENERFLKWIRARYRWTGDHYRRLRAAMPPQVLLWGCASDCVAARLAGIAYSPQHFAPYFDAIFHEIVGRRQPGTHDELIASDIAGFASIARHHNKPLLAIFYVRHPDDLPAWMRIMSRHGSRPWISKLPRAEDAISEEELLAHGYPDIPPTPSRHDGFDGIVFSESARDRLGPRAEELYVQPYRQLCNRLVEQGRPVDVFFDSFRSRPQPSKWQRLWVPGSPHIDAELSEMIGTWERNGLPVERM